MFIMKNYLKLLLKKLSIRLLKYKFVPKVLFFCFIFLVLKMFGYLKCNAIITR